jgi:replicative DNA helicase
MSDEKSKSPPHDDELERAVLCCALKDPASIMIKLQPSDFYSRAHQRIYEAAQKVSGMGFDPDFHAVIEELKKNGLLDEGGGAAYISSLLNIVPSVANADYYAREVKDCSLRRGMLRLASFITKYAYDEPLNMRQYLKETLGEIETITLSYRQFLNNPKKFKKAIKLAKQSI